MYIPVMAKGFQQQFWQAVAKGSEDAAKDLGVEIYFDGPASETELDAQVNMVKTALAKNPKAMALAALSTDADTEILEECAEKNIPVIGFDSGVPGDTTGAVKATACTNNENAAAIAAAMVRERTRVAFFIVSPSFFHVRSAFFSQISPDQTKSAQPRRQAVAARLCAKANSLLFFLCFCLRNQNGVRSFCTADPVVLAPCLDCSDYSILPKFCKHFLSASGRFLPPIALFY